MSYNETIYSPLSPNPAFGLISPSINSNVPESLERSYESLLELSNKRIALLHYLKSCHEGNAFFLNGVAISLEDLAQNYENDKMKKRTLSLFSLGLSIGNILLISNPNDFVKAYTQLMFEYETRRDSKSGAGEKMKQIFSRRPSKDSTQSISAGTTYYEISQISIELDYLQTVTALIDVMVASYEKFAEDAQSLDSGNSSSQQYVDHVIRVDIRLKKIILSMLKEIEEIAKAKLKEVLHEDLSIFDV
ncbi:hypothetical protein HK098_007165 [Nowakowskiella sp. JEL0407]|nr:hypothetical protein HK098_007165 [Nowakowskiella sp. JEL0407]